MGERGNIVAINMMCTNTECKYYWEDNCQRNLEEKRIEIDEYGKCITFEPGRCEYYELEKASILNDGIGNVTVEEATKCLREAMEDYKEITNDHI